MGPYGLRSPSLPSPSHSQLAANKLCTHAVPLNACSPLLTQKCSVVRAKARGAERFTVHKEEGRTAPLYELCVKLLVKQNSPLAPKSYSCGSNAAQTRNETQASEPYDLQL